MKTLSSFPFPKRNPNYQDEEIFYHKNDSEAYVQYYYNKLTSSESITISNQYFLIEEMILNSFQYVTPIQKNSETCSVKFAAIIREACSLFELIMRKTYHQFFIYPDEYDLNIFNFLSLDAYLNLSKEKLKSPRLDTYIGDGKSIEPFQELKDWNRLQGLTSANIPKWWIAYNKIKHNTESIIEFSTLDNAIYSIAAIFVLIQKIFGSGLISAFLRKPSDNKKNEILLFQIRTSELFFGETLKTARRY